MPTLPTSDDPLTHATSARTAPQLYGTLVTVVSNPLHCHRHMQIPTPCHFLLLDARHPPLHPHPPFTSPTPTLGGRTPPHHLTPTLPVTPLSATAAPTSHLPRAQPPQAGVVGCDFGPECWLAQCWGPGLALALRYCRSSFRSFGHHIGHFHPCRPSSFHLHHHR